MVVCLLIDRGVRFCRVIRMTHGTTALLHIADWTHCSDGRFMLFSEEVVQPTFVAHVFFLARIHKAPMSFVNCLSTDSHKLSLNFINWRFWPVTFLTREISSHSYLFSLNYAVVRFYSSQLLSFILDTVFQRLTTLIINATSFHPRSPYDSTRERKLYCKIPQGTLRKLTYNECAHATVINTLSASRF